MQHLSRYSARWIIPIFDHFRFATLKQLLHIAITTADWGRLYKLLYVVLDASILFPSDDIAVHENANTLMKPPSWNRAIIELMIQARGVWVDKSPTPSYVQVGVHYNVQHCLSFLHPNVILC